MWEFRVKMISDHMHSLVTIQMPCGKLAGIFSMESSQAVSPTILQQY